MLLDPLLASQYQFHTYRFTSRYYLHRDLVYLSRQVLQSVFWGKMGWSVVLRWQVTTEYDVMSSSPTQTRNLI